MSRFASRSSVGAIVLSLRILIVPQLARAACNLIPQTTKTFGSAVGSSNRPYAAPGEPIELHVRPCDSASTSPTGFVDPPGNYVVTVIFTPEGAAHNAVILATNCTGLAGACQSQLGGSGTATCLPGVTAGAGQTLDVVTRDDGPHLRVKFPDTDQLFDGIVNGRTYAGPATIAVTKVGDPLACDLQATPCSGHTGLVACIDDFFENDGACGTLTPNNTFGHFTALPPPNDYVANCFDTIGPCNPSSPEVRVTTDAAGNVLLPIDWSGVLVRQNAVPVPRSLSAALLVAAAPVTLPGKSFVASYTPEGGLLDPIFEPQFNPQAVSQALNLFGFADAPYTVLRVARRSATYQQCVDGANDGGPCNSAEDCPAACANDPTQRCTTDTDCTSSTCGTPGTCITAKCSNGPNAGQPCNTDDNCPSGECGPALFNVASLATGGSGPIVVQRLSSSGLCQQSTLPANTEQMCSIATPCTGNGPCVQYALAAESPVPLDGLIGSMSTFAFVSHEGVDVVDRNGDTDTNDSVVTLADRETGVGQALGAPDGFQVGFPMGTNQLPACGLSGTPQGRAVIDNLEVPFRFPAVATEGQTVAFLESERAQNYCDENDDSDRSDALLRVFTLGGGETKTGTCAGGANAGHPCALHADCPSSSCLARAMDPALLINHRSIIASNGLVFARHSEAMQARNVPERVNVTSAGVQTNFEVDLVSLTGQMAPVALSGDGRFVAFYSASINLGPFPSTNVIVRDRQLHSTTLASVNDTGTPVTQITNDPRIAMSADGRFVAFSSPATTFLSTPDTNSCDDIFVHDRDLDDNGVFDEAGAGKTTTTRVSLSDTGAQSSPSGSCASHFPSISADGRFVAFTSAATNLVTGDSNGFIDCFVRDRDLDGNGVFDEPGAGKTTTLRVDVSTAGVAADNDCLTPVISGNGRFVAFASKASNLVANDPNGQADVFVRDLVAGTTEIVSIRNDGSLGGGFNAVNDYPAISADGRFVAFSANDLAMVTDAIGVTSPRMVVHDRLTGLNHTVSVDDQGLAFNAFGPAFSADGRFVAFMFRSGGGEILVPNESTQLSDIFVHDQRTGITERVSLAADGSAGTGPAPTATAPGAFGPALTADGATVGFYATFTNLVTGDTNGYTDVFVRGPDTTDTASDVTGDGDRNDTVLEAVTSSGSIVELCPADQVAVAGGTTAFLRPESAGTTPSLSLCPTGPLVGGEPDLNGNGSADDEVVHYWRGGASAVQNLERAATDVSLSAVCTGGSSAGNVCAADADCPGGGTCKPSFIAALVSEAGQTTTDATGLNADGDTNDTVVEVHNVTDAPTKWTNVGQAADVEQAAGPLVVFISPETAENRDLDADGDQSDRVLQVYDVAAKKTTNTMQTAEEFVVGTQTASCGDAPVIAFRTHEADMCGVPVDATTCTAATLPSGCQLSTCDLNQDGDCCDDVLQFQVPGRGVVNSGFAVTPCRLEACDPRFPYRVLGDTVKFLTFECDQGGAVTNGCAAGGSDLNGNGNAGDLILQLFNVCTGERTVIGGIDPNNKGSDPVGPGPFPSRGNRCMEPTVPSVSCSVDASCPSGSGCFENTCKHPAAVMPSTCDCPVGSAGGAACPDCPAGTTCEADSISVAPATPPAHDAVVQPRKPVTLTIPMGQPSKTKSVFVKVTNADISDKVGHAIRLIARDGTCPAGTVVGVPKLSKDPNSPDTVVLKGKKSKAAKVTVAMPASSVTTQNELAPARCTLLMQAVTLVSDNADPSPSNDTFPVELNLLDANDTLQATPNEVVIRSMNPVKVTLGRKSTMATKTVKATVINADTVTHTITVSASDGNCPPNTIGTITPASVMLQAGKSAKVNVPITVHGTDFNTSNPKIPGRCTALLTATGAVTPGMESDASNNSSHLVIDVLDKHDFP